MSGVLLDTAGAGTEVGLWIARLLNHLTFTGTVGLLLVPAWLRRGSAGEQHRTGAAVGHRLTRLAAMLALAWAVSGLALFVFGLSNAAARPLPEALTQDLATRFAGTRFGASVLAQSVMAAVVAVLAAAARDRLLATVALVGALLAGLGPAWWGHARTADLAAVAVASDWLHVVAAALWVGGLAAVTLLVLRWDPEGDIASPVRRFSAVATWALPAVLVTGVLNTAMHMSAVDQLLTTQWGRFALAKAVALVLIAGLGLLHRRRSLPRLAQDDGRSVFRRYAGVELALMVGAFALATTMSSGLPAEVEAAARIQAATVPLGEGRVELTLDPAATGPNELHVYIYDARGTLRPVDEAEMVFRAGTAEVRPRLIPTGPGHYTGLDVRFEQAGSYQVRVQVIEGGQTDEATATLVVR
jgi:putative copper export protein